MMRPYQMKVTFREDSKEEYFLVNNFFCELRDEIDYLVLECLRGEIKAFKFSDIRIFTVIP